MDAQVAKTDEPPAYPDNDESLIQELDRYRPVSDLVCSEHRMPVLSERGPEIRLGLSGHCVFSWWDLERGCAGFRSPFCRHHAGVSRHTSDLTEMAGREGDPIYWGI